MQFYTPLTVIVGHNGSGKTVRSSLCAPRWSWTISGFCARFEPKEGDRRLTCRGRPSSNASSTRRLASFPPAPRAVLLFMTLLCVPSVSRAAYPCASIAARSRNVLMNEPRANAPVAPRRMLTLFAGRRSPARTRSRRRSSSASTIRARRRCSSSAACRSRRRRPSRACR